MKILLNQPKVGKKPKSHEGARRELGAFQELLNNSIRHSKALIGQERRDAKEKQIQLQQEIQDQMQRIKE